MAGFKRGQDALDSYDNSKPKLNTSFAKDIKWQDGDKKFIAFLNPIDYIVTVDLHEWVPVGTGTTKAGKSYTRYENFIDRRDFSIGENSDDLTDRLGHRPKKRTMAVAVELEPISEKVNGRLKPVSFEVATETYVRKTDEGEEEEVEAPTMGIITQAKSNFFGYLGSYDATSGPIEEAVFQIIRRGGDADTAYDFFPFTLPVDYGKLIVGWQNVGYLRGVELEDEGHEDPRAQAIAIGNAFLDKRLEELIDKDRYDHFVTPIEYIEDKFGNSKPREKSVNGPSFDDMIPPVDGNDVHSKVNRVRKQYAGSSKE